MSCYYNVQYILYMLFPHCSPSLLMKRGTVQVHKNPQPPAKPEKPKSRGFRNTLRNLRDRLRTDHKTLVRVNYVILLQCLLLQNIVHHISPLFSSQTAACSDPVVQRRHLERSDLHNFSIKDLNALSTSLSKTIQGTHTVILQHS